MKRAVPVFLIVLALVTILVSPVNGPKLVQPQALADGTRPLPPYHVVNGPVPTWQDGTRPLPPYFDGTRPLPPYLS